MFTGHLHDSSKVQFCNLKYLILDFYLKENLSF